MCRLKQQFTIFFIVAFIFAFCCVARVQAKNEGANDSHRFAINFNEAMNRCIQSGCTNVEEIIGFFADESSYIDDAGQVWNGKANIRKRLLRIKSDAATSDRIEGIDVAGSLVTLRLERRRVFKTGKYDAAEIKPHVQVILLKNGRIARLISVISPDEK